MNMMQACVQKEQAAQLDDELQSLKLTGARIMTGGREGNANCTCAACVHDYVLVFGCMLTGTVLAAEDTNCAIVTNLACIASKSRLLLKVFLFHMYAFQLLRL